MMVSNGSDEGFCEKFKVSCCRFLPIIITVRFSMVKSVKSRFHFHGSIFSYLLVLDASQVPFLGTLNTFFNVKDFLFDVATRENYFETYFQHFKMRKNSFLEKCDTKFTVWAKSSRVHEHKTIICHLQFLLLIYFPFVEHFHVIKMQKVLSRVTE